MKKGFKIQFDTDSYSFISANLFIGLWCIFQLKFFFDAGKVIYLM